MNRKRVTTSSAAAIGSLRSSLLGVRAWETQRGDTEYRQNENQSERRLERTKQRQRTSRRHTPEISFSGLTSFILVRSLSRPDVSFVLDDIPALILETVCIHARHLFTTCSIAASFVLQHASNLLRDETSNRGYTAGLLREKKKWASRKVEIDKL